MDVVASLDRPISTFLPLDDPPSDGVLDEEFEVEGEGGEGHGEGAREVRPVVLQKLRVAGGPAAERPGGPADVHGLVRLDEGGPEDELHDGVGPEDLGVVEGRGGDGP